MQVAPPKVDHLSHDAAERPRCKVCAAGRDGRIDLTRIEKLLADGKKISMVARRYRLSSDSLSRHWAGISEERRNFLRAGGLERAALQAKAEEEKVATIDHLRIIRSSLYRALAQALELRDHAAVAAIGNALTRGGHRRIRCVLGRRLAAELAQYVGILLEIGLFRGAHPAQERAKTAALRGRDIAPGQDADALEFHFFDLGQRGHQCSTPFVCVARQ
jgi:hypothetical protein